MTPSKEFFFKYYRLAKTIYPIRSFKGKRLLKKNYGNSFEITIVIFFFVAVLNCLSERSEEIS